MRIVGEGGVGRILGVWTDISERKGAVAELEAREARLAFQAQLLDHVSQPVVATDPGGTITYWNEAAERLFGWTAAEAVGRLGSELLRTSWHPGVFEGMVAALRSPAS